MTVKDAQKLASSTGLFLVTDPQQVSQYRQLVERVQKTYDVEPVPKWGLDYKLYLSKPETAKSKAEPPSSQHILHLSHQRSTVFIALDQPAGSTLATSNSDKAITATGADASPSTTSTAPTAAASKQDAIGNAPQNDQLFIVKVSDTQKEATLAILNTKMALLWTIKTSLTVSGVTFRVQDTWIRIGEVRAGTSANVRALVVAIETPSIVDDDDDDDDDDDTDHHHHNNDSNVAPSVSPAEQERVHWEVSRIRDDIGLLAFAKEAWGYAKEESVVTAWCTIMKLR